MESDFKKKYESWPTLRLLQRDILLIDNTIAECRGRVVSTPASYSGGPVFKSRPGHRLS
jgi:hypothetical protein